MKLNVGVEGKGVTFTFLSRWKVKVYFFAFSTGERLCTGTAEAARSGTLLVLTAAEFDYTADYTRLPRERPKPELSQAFVFACLSVVKPLETRT